MDSSMENKKVGACRLHNWVEERATSQFDMGPRSYIHKNGHQGILSTDLTSKLEDMTTVRAAFPSPKSSGLRQKGSRSELEKYLFRTISKEVYEEFNPPPPKTNYCSTTKEDYKVEGFKSVIPPPAQEHDYKTEQPMSFWRENFHHVQGVSSVSDRTSPFKKNATFSTPIGERLGEPYS